MKFYTLSIFAVFLSSPVFAGPDQFDLICSGVVKKTKQDSTTNASWSTRYRIDLHRKIFYTNRCSSLELINKFDEGSIYLNNYSSSAGMSVILINRMSGGLSKILAINSPPAKEKSFDSVHANCKVARFSGIPRRF